MNIIEATDPVVTVEQGTIVGRQLEFSVGESTHTIDAYRGIPYAEAPIGELRFKPPVPKKWQGNLNAQKYGMVCPQNEMDFMNFTESAGKDEDCLVLNVYVPQPTVSKADSFPEDMCVGGGGEGALGVFSVWGGWEAAPKHDMRIFCDNVSNSKLEFWNSKKISKSWGVSFFSSQNGKKYLYQKWSEFGGGGISMSSLTLPLLKVKKLVKVLGFPCLL